MARAAVVKKRAAHEWDVRAVKGAFERLERAKAFSTVVRGLPVPVLKRLLKDALPRRAASAMPIEVWASLATGIALDSPLFAVVLAETLHDHLGWDREPGSLDDWWAAVRQQPLEALWMAALSAHKTVRKEFAHLAEHCLENFRSSPACQPPSWEFVDAVLVTHVAQQQDLRALEREADEAGRRLHTDRERFEELREELKRTRRENAELRAARALAERDARERNERAAAVQAARPDLRRFEELERRARKAEKECQHLSAELERERQRSTAAPAATSAFDLARAAVDSPDEPHDAEPAAIARDPNPRRRVLRQMVRKLLKKGKVGASHTHEDNVYRGVPDHEKGVAKAAMELLYREGWLMPKPTVNDPHVSLSPERVPEVKALIAGEVVNLRVLEFVAG